MTNNARCGWENQRLSFCFVKLYTILLDMIVWRFSLWCQFRPSVFHLSILIVLWAEQFGKLWRVCIDCTFFISSIRCFSRDLFFLSALSSLLFILAISLSECMRVCVCTQAWWVIICARSLLLSNWSTHIEIPSVHSWQYKHMHRFVQSRSAYTHTQTIKQSKTQRNTTKAQKFFKLQFFENVSHGHRCNIALLDWDDALSFSFLFSVTLFICLRICIFAFWLDGAREYQTKHHMCALRKYKGAWVHA